MKRVKAGNSDSLDSKIPMLLHSPRKIIIRRIWASQRCWSRKQRRETTSWRNNWPDMTKRTKTKQSTKIKMIKKVNKNSNSIKNWCRKVQKSLGTTFWSLNKPQMLRLKRRTKIWRNLKKKLKSKKEKRNKTQRNRSQRTKEKMFYNKNNNNWRPWKPLSCLRKIKNTSPKLSPLTKPGFTSQTFPTKLQKIKFIPNSANSEILKR